MEAFLASALVVAIGEIGDKTQLLALMLAVRFKRPWPIAFGILTATLANHAAAGFLGSLISSAISPDTLRWGVGLSFLAIAVWALRPDTLDAQSSSASAYGVFLMTAGAFFLAEIGDKTQIATIALAARYTDLAAVVAGTTSGMLIADLPVVFFGEKTASKIPLKIVRYVAAALFAVMGLMTLSGSRLPGIGGTT